MKKVNRFLFLSLLVVFVLFATMNTAYAQDYYVSTSGNDGNSGTIINPFRTIDHAVDQCGGGDTVYVRNGIYTEGITISNSGTENGYNTLTNYHDESPTIKRSNIYNHGISVSANYWIIDGFEITNTWHPVTVGKGYHDVIMKNLDCHRNGYSLVLNDGSYNMLIEDCSFHHPHSGSTNFIGLRGEDDFISHHITIRDCSFDGCGHNSINFYTSQANEHYDGTTDILIEGCTFTDGRQVAIFTNWCGATRMVVRDCYFDHCSRGIQAVMRDCLIENCIAVDHGHHFVYSQADANSWNVTVRDINAHAGTWGSSNPCVNLFKGHDFYVYCVTATGDFSRTSTPAQIPDPRPDPTPTPTPTTTPDPTVTPTETATPDPTPTNSDNRLKQSTPDIVLGSSPWLDVGKLGDNNYNSVLWFDIPNKTVESATLSLYWYYESRDTATEIELYRPAAWNPLYTNWNSYDNGLNWLNPGGDCFEKYDTITLTGTPDNQYHGFDVTDLVNNYIGGTYDNTGFLIKANDNDGYVAFYSMDHPNVNQRPKLELSYIPDPTPTPTTTPDPMPTQTATPDPTPTEPPEHPRHDVNKDGIVDMLDLDIVASHYGEIIN